MIHEHAAHKILTRLGRSGAAQFTDLNPDQTVFQRRYVREVSRCDDVERKLTYLDQQIDRYEVIRSAVPDVDAFLDRLEVRTPNDGSSRRNNLDRKSYMDELELRTNEKEAELLQLNMYNTSLSEDFYSQKERQHVLQKAKEYMHEEGGGMASEAHSVNVGADEETEGGGYDSLRFKFITGVVNLEDRVKFERMIFRSTRGNCFMKFYDIDENTYDVVTKELVAKTVFIVFFQAPYIESKIKRICEAFSARLYQIPDLNNGEALDGASVEVFRDLQDRERVLDKNKSDITILLSEVGQYIEVWKWIALHEKSIYHTMNCFAADVNGLLRAEAWVLSDKRDEVSQMILQVHAELMGDGSSQTLPSYVHTVSHSGWPTAPPTFFKTNKFTECFQVIVDTYGVPTYREANPAVMTVMTFPFAFGVMFGDIGHGAILSIFMIWFIWNEKKMERLKGNELIGMIYGGRYLMLFMGLFAFYCGWVYNDFFAMGLKIFTPCWEAAEPYGIQGPEDVAYKPIDGCVYPFGIDPTWHRSSNDLLYMNSVKMKMAVIFGVIQMVCGLFHRVGNALYFHRGSLMSNLDLWFEAVPMLVFMISLFGYMCFAIIYKWSVPWQSDCVATLPDNWYTFDNSTKCQDAAPADRVTHCSSTFCAEADVCRNCIPPALITTLINIALAIGDVPIEEQLYSGQATVQVILLLIAVVMVPLMLVPKPYFLIKRINKQHEMTHNDAASDHSATELIQDDHHAHEEEHSNGDIVIHQAIETIEFTLGCISNTASYLRLWALSLAHSQLSSVFLEKAMFIGITDAGFGGVMLTFIGYAVFAAITFAVLLLMDNLECFLHALRLHWVEFQNKFFKGEGHAFAPLHFTKVLIGQQ